MKNTYTYKGQKLQTTNDKFSDDASNLSCI